MGIILRRLPEVLEGLLQILLGPLVPVVAPLEVKIIGLESFLVRAAQPQPQFLGDLTRDLLLHLKDVGELWLEMLAPQNITSMEHVDQFDTDRESLGAPDDSTGQHAVHP